jgi:hypothetical protein
MLSTALDDPSAVPYFLWDEPMSVAALRHRLQFGSPEERIRLLAKVLREARDTDAWKFTTPRDVLRQWSEISIQLGRRRAFWDFLLRHWQRAGLLNE